MESVLDKKVRRCHVMTEEILGDIGAKLENALRKSLEKLAQQA
jgi:hypothetical protein